MGVVYFAQAFQSLKELKLKAIPNYPRVHVVLGHEPTIGPIKIGWSRRLYGRLHEISSRAKCRVWLLGAFLGELRDERSMHEMFAHLRTPHPFSGAGTEWFRQAPELTNFILSLPRPPLTGIEFTQCSLPRGRNLGATPPLTLTG